MSRSEDQTEITRVIDDLVGVTEDVVKGITLDLTAELIEVMPVDVGWAKAKWVPSLTPARGSAPSRGDVASATAAQSAGVAAIATGYTLDKGAVFVSNNVPYIQMLNDGHSEQEPAGFIERAIDTAINEYR